MNLQRLACCLWLFADYAFRASLAFPFCILFTAYLCIVSFWPSPCPYLNDMCIKLRPGHFAASLG